MARRCASLLALAAVAAWSAGGTGCAPDAPGAIGVVMPLTGSMAAWGAELQSGLALGFDERPDPARRVLWSDNGGSAIGTTAAVEHLVAQGATLIIGPLTTDNAVTAGIVARSLGVPLVVPAATGPDVTPPGGATVRLCYEDAAAGRALARWAAADAGLSRMAVVIDLDSAYSLGLAAAFEREYRRLGRRVVGEVSYRAGGEDRDAVLDAVAALDVDGALLAGYAPDIEVMVRGARSDGIARLVLLGGDAWSGADVGRALAGRVRGAYHARHFDPGSQAPRARAFVSAYERAHGVPPPDLAALGYDAAGVVLSVFDPRAAGDELLVRLRGVRDVEGVTGPISLDPLGSAMSRPVVLVRVDVPGDPQVVARLDG